MPFPRPRLPSIWNSSRVLKIREKLAKLASPRTPADAGSRSSTITCSSNGNVEYSDPLTESISLFRDTFSSTKRRRWRRQSPERNENVEKPKMDPIYPTFTAPSNDALDVSSYASSSRTLPESELSTSPFAEDDTRSLGTASCMPHEPAWQALLPAEQLDEARNFDESTSDAREQPKSFQDMLCNIQPTVVTEEPAEDTRSFTERDNDALRGYFSVRTNIVLTSTCPEIAPHIVITPVREAPEDYYTPWLNRVDYHCQNLYFLAVPAIDPIRLARLPYGDEASYWPVTRSHAGESMGHGIPHRVFSRSRFNQSVDESASESLTMYHVVTALQRHRFKAVAIETCERAQKLRSRYDDTDILETIEKPFVWTDPAEPLMKLPNFPGIVLFDSPNPFSAPHIMVWTPPQQDPWIPYSTATNDPQDGGFGRYLTVPSRHVSFINMPASHYRYGDNDLDDEEYESYESYSPIDDDGDYCDSPSEPSSPEPITPIDLEDNVSYRPWDCNDLPDDEDNDDLKNTGSQYISKIEIQDIPSRPSKPLFYFDDEEEDDLPPLDDWYISVAQRNGMQITA